MSRTINEHIDQNDVTLSDVGQVIRPRAPKTLANRMNDVATPEESSILLSQIPGHIQEEENQPSFSATESWLSHIHFLQKIKPSNRSVDAPHAAHEVNPLISYSTTATASSATVTEPRKDQSPFENAPNTKKNLSLSLKNIVSMGCTYANSPGPTNLSGAKDLQQRICHVDGNHQQCCAMVSTGTSCQRIPVSHEPMTCSCHNTTMSYLNMSPNKRTTRGCLVQGNDWYDLNIML